MPLVAGPTKGIYSDAQGEISNFHCQPRKKNENADVLPTRQEGNRRLKRNCMANKPVKMDIQKDVNKPIKNNLLQEWFLGCFVVVIEKNTVEFSRIKCACNCCKNSKKGSKKSRNVELIQYTNYKGIAYKIQIRYLR